MERNYAGRTRAILLSPLGKFRSLSTPRPVDGRLRQAGLLARGWESRHHLPGSRSSGIDAGHTAYSCGGSPGISPEFPFNPRAGELVVRS